MKIGTIDIKFSLILSFLIRLFLYIQHYPEYILILIDIVTSL